MQTAMQVQRSAAASGLLRGRLAALSAGVRHSRGNIQVVAAAAQQQDVLLRRCVWLTVCHTPPAKPYTTSVP
jgi:hypothetical protein